MKSIKNRNKQIKTVKIVVNRSRMTTGWIEERKLAISCSPREQLSTTNFAAGRPATVGIANRGDSRGICRVQRKVVLLGLRCRIPAPPCISSPGGNGGGFFSAPQLQRGRRKMDMPLRIRVTAKCHRTCASLPRRWRVRQAELHLRSLKHKRDKGHPGQRRLDKFFIKLLNFPWCLYVTYSWNRR